MLGSSWPHGGLIGFGSSPELCAVPGGSYPASMWPQKHKARSAEQHKRLTGDRKNDEGYRGGYACGRSEEHTSELQSLMRISYAVFCLNKKKTNNNIHKNR